MLLRFFSEASWPSNQMEVLCNTSLGSTMACRGLEEDQSTTRDRILPDIGEYPPMGLVPTPKECRSRIVIDLGILIIPTTGLFSA